MDGDVQTLAHRDALLDTDGDVFWSRSPVGRGVSNAHGVQTMDPLVPQIELDRGRPRRAPVHGVAARNRLASGQNGIRSTGAIAPNPARAVSHATPTSMSAVPANSSKEHLVDRDSFAPHGRVPVAQESGFG